MPVVPYYLGRSAHVWITAMSRRNSAWQAREGGGNDRGDVLPLRVASWVHCDDTVANLLGERGAVAVRRNVI